MAESVSVKQLLEAGAHFGHQTGHWHPKMKNYIFTQRNGIHIIDLEQTVTLLGKACAFVRDLVSSGQTILFVGTKKQAQDIIEEEAKRCGMFYVNQRWLGGMLTNFNTIQARIDYLVRLEDKTSRGELDYLSKKDRMKTDKEMAKLNKLMGGFKERIALSEARKVGVKIVATVDTNCDPDGIDYIIPSNDDAIKAIKVICTFMADAVIEGKMLAESEMKDAEVATPVSSDAVAA